MTNINGGNNFIKFGKQQVELGKSDGVKRETVVGQNGRENSIMNALFNRFDTNKDNILDNIELDVAYNYIKTAAQNGNMSNAEVKKLAQELGVDVSRDDIMQFTETLANEQDDVKATWEGNTYTVRDGNKTTITEYADDAHTQPVKITVKEGNKKTVTEMNGTQKTVTTTIGTGDNVVSTTVETFEGDKPTSKTVTRGAVTTEYEYDDNGNVSKEVTTNQDGTTITKEGEKTTTVSPDGKTVIDEGNTHTEILASGREITTVTGENGEKTVTVKDGDNTVELRYDEDGNILSNAKQGESFEQTARRLGIEPDTPEYNQFRELNSQAANKGWFQVGAEVKIPAGMEDKIKIDGINVDAAAERQNFNQQALNNVDVSQYNDSNTHKITLEQNTTWWELAKQNLIEGGNQSPNRAEISQRALELQKLNQGKEPGQGVEITVPGATTASAPAGESGVTNAEENSEDFQYSLAKMRQQYPEDQYNIRVYNEDANDFEIRDKATNKMVLLVRGHDYTTFTYNEDGTSSRSTYKDGKISETTFYNDNRKVTSTYEYDNNGNVEYIFDADGNRRFIPAENLYNDIHAKRLGIIPTTGENIAEHIESITPENVLEVMKEYKRMSNPDNPDEGESLIAGIMSERGLSKEERISYINHIKDAYFENARQSGVYTADMETNFDNELRHQMEKIGLAEADYLDVFTRKIDNRDHESMNGVMLGESLIIKKDNIAANGQIDGDFAQGHEGDCWLLASIKAIANTPNGLQILNDSLSVDDNGNVTVTLKGVGKSYTITAEELNGNNNLSTGDLDIRAIEIAVDKYFLEERGVNGRLDIDGNSEHVAFQILTGKGGRGLLSDIYGRIPEKWFSDSQIDNFNKENHIACVGAKGHGRESFAVPDGNNIELIKGHAYTVSRSDQDNVYLINPHDSSKEIAVPRDVFKEFFNLVDEFDL